MVVDDNADFAELLALELHASGYVTQTVTDGEAAWGLVEHFQPHCVLMDVHMPRLDGLELCRKLRARFGDDVVLIAMSGVDAGDPRVSATFDMVDHYLRKPFDLALLRRALPPLAPR